MSVRILMHKA